MEKKCQLEIIQAHQFLEGWMAGKIEKTEVKFNRFAESIADEFRITYPNGHVKNRVTMLSEIWEAHNTQNDSLTIEIRNYHSLMVTDSVCIVTYEECLHTKEPSCRVSSAVFRLAKDQKTVEWIHVQETWMDGQKSSPDS